MGELGAFHVHFKLLCNQNKSGKSFDTNDTLKKKDLWGAAADLCRTLSGRSRRGSPGCPCGPSPRGAAAGPAASAGAAAPVLKSPAGADSSCPSLQVSEEGKEQALTARR